MQSLIMIIFWNFVFFLTVSLIHCGRGQESSVTDEFIKCTSRTECAECIQTPECSWCSNWDFYDANKQPLSRCNTTLGHEQLGRFKCPNLFTPINEKEIIKNEDFLKGKTAAQTTIKPQIVQVKLRKRVPFELELEYKDPTDYPLDLYYLMDLTKTMEDDKVFLSQLGKQLGEKLADLTQLYQQGFGSFIDKVVMPYVRISKDWLENPCKKSGNCTKPYSFKHHLSLSQNLEQFAKEVEDAMLSGSVDKPEGGFDALMQAMVCGEKIGWSKDSRKVLIMATDAPFHLAGDAKLGGIIRPNDGKCHLNDAGYYTYSTEMDYPSIAQLNYQAIRNSVNIIFAVTEEQLDVYKELARNIEGAKSALLSNDSSNIVDLVVEEYQKITSRVELSDNFPKQYVSVKYYSKCLNENGELIETKACVDLPVGSKIKFTVKIELLECPENKEAWQQQLKIYRVGLVDSLLVKLEMLCDCPCENENNWTLNSKKCGGNGIEKCGLCKCQEPYFGKYCECNAMGESVPADETKACTAEDATEVCSGRGSCVCGQCDCNEIGDTKKKFSGRFCECDNVSCEQANGEICGGHGSCDCGKCVCLEGWEGSACNCATDKKACMQPDSDELCSGNGECVCGKCEKCDNKYSGTYCEKCLHKSCPNRCEEFSPCVQCKLFGTGLYENAGECELRCYKQPIEKVDVISQESYDDEFYCESKDSSDDCIFRFAYRQLPDKPVYIDAQKAKECPPTPPIFWILAAIISVIVIGGLCLIIAWKLYTIVLDKREYAKFEKESKDTAFQNTENPLYQTPVGIYQNPIYGKQMK